MALLLRDPARAIHKIERLLKVGEFKRSVKMMLPDHFPIGQLRLKRVKRIALERGNAAAAGNTGLVC
jgi:hypothetical protein